MLRKSSKVTGDAFKSPEPFRTEIIGAVKLAATGE